MRVRIRIRIRIPPPLELPTHPEKVTGQRGGCLPAPLRFSRSLLT